ncbi:von Willebrand factor type A domain-containing protein [Cladophialophora immunda]|nr:von Willebrand factor type A domain-containing protein [Cladophialophora immunda]
MSSYFHDQRRLCGCWFVTKEAAVARQYLPQIELSSHTNILATTSRTTLTQTFVNNQDHSLEEVRYTFPLYDGVSVVGFKCTVGSKTIVGVVKEKQQARAEYQEAVERGETAGLLEQLPEAADVFTTSVGNVPAKEKLHVELVYLGELKHDAETDGSRFTIPTIIAPRYGSLSSDSATAMSSTQIDKGRIAICVDVTLEEGSIVQGLQSPSHPIAVTMGRTSVMEEDSFNNNHASATLTLGTSELQKDFIVVVLAKGTGNPNAFLETHPSIPNQRALMTTLVPKFNLPNISPEIVFIVDRSGSMHGQIELLVAAMKVFLKSLPVGAKFNICSFGSSFSFLFKKSTTYDQSSLKDALNHLDTFDANYGGTEMLQPVKATVENRFKDLPLEVMLLTDGQIWNQQELFTLVKETPNARFFSLGIGHGASPALVEGIARAGNGFAQFVGPDEKMDKRVVRMLKGALTPHVTDYTLEVKYTDDSEEEDFEMVDRENKEEAVVPVVSKKPISLFDPTATEEPTNPPANRYDNLPAISVPKVIPAPYKIPALFPFSRTTVYLLLSPEAPRKTLKSVVLRGTSSHGPLELEIPVQDVGVGETIHQLAAKKAILELEEGGGWIANARNADGQLLKSVHEGKWDLIVEREAVRLGVEFQVGGKWCSFVAVDNNAKTVEEHASKPLPLQPRRRLLPDRDIMDTSLPELKRSQLRELASICSATVPAPPPASSSMLFCAAPPAPSQSSRSFGGGEARFTDIRRPPAGGGGGEMRCSDLGSRPAGGRGGFLSRSVNTTPPWRAKWSRSGSGSAGQEALPGEEAGPPKAPVDMSALSNGEKMHRLIGLVEFDGSWLRSNHLLALLGVTEQQFTSVSVPVADAGADTVRATVLAVAWLKAKVASEKDVWEMVAEKATEWLATRLGGEEKANKAIEQAESLV